MVRPRFKPVAPDQRIRDLRKEDKAVLKDEPGPERAARLAAHIRNAHEERQLNMAMHAAQLCLDEDPDSPELLVGVYLDDEDDAEVHLRNRKDLADLGRYLNRPDIVDRAMAGAMDAAESWVRDGDEGEQRFRLRRLISIFTREFSDDVRDRLR